MSRLTEVLGAEIGFSGRGICALKLSSPSSLTQVFRWFYSQEYCGISLTDHWLLLGITTSTGKLCFCHPYDQIQCVLIFAHVEHLCAHAWVGASTWVHLCEGQRLTKVSSLIISTLFLDIVSFAECPNYLSRQPGAPKIFFVPTSTTLWFEFLLIILVFSRGAADLDAGAWPAKPSPQSAIFVIIFFSPGWWSFFLSILYFWSPAICFGNNMYLLYCVRRTTVQDA